MNCASVSTKNFQQKYTKQTNLKLCAFKNIFKTYPEFSDAFGSNGMYIVNKELRITTAYDSIINRYTNGLKFCTRRFCYVVTALLCFTPTFLSGATLPFLLREHKYV